MTKQLLTSLLLLLCVNNLFAQFTYPRHEKTEWTPYTLEEMQGDVCIPVVFVNFQQENSDNQKTITADQQTKWMQQLNESCSTNHMGNNGSVSDYFNAQSYGKLNVTFENIGTYTASGKAADYADHASDAKLVVKAVQSLNGIDWSRYDRNADNDVDCLLLIFAGHADGDYNSAGHAVTSIYPHQNWLTNCGQSKAAVSNGYNVQTYVFVNNQRDSSTSIDAINTASHELSHGILDLPDYYKSGYSYMGQYDAMCYGFRQTGYGTADNHCCDYTSFNRMFLGWITPTVLTTPCHVKLQPLSKSPQACIIADPSDPNHFYLLENRAKLSNTWDYHLPAGGLLLVEVHYNKSNFLYHSVNSATRKNLTLVSAGTNKPVAFPNGSYYNIDQSVVPFGINGHTQIPAAVNTIFSTQTVTNITVNADGTVEFDFMGGGEEIDLGIKGNPAYNERENENCYNLLGQRISSTSPAITATRTPNIYIKGGKKYLCHKQ